MLGEGPDSGTDAEVVQWRRLVVTKRFGGRNAEFERRLPVVTDSYISSKKPDY